MILVAAAVLAAPAVSKWVYFGEDHKLHYRADEHGNRIVDFSYAGYRGGAFPRGCVEDSGAGDPR